MTHVLEEFRSRLARAAADLRDGGTHPDDALGRIDESVRLAREAADAVDGHVRASLEPLHVRASLEPLPDTAR